jgi:cellulose synthase operon protein C
MRLGETVVTHFLACGTRSKRTSLTQSKQFSAIAVLIIVGLSFAGCKGDPNIKKQKFLDSGNKYLENKQFREAAIQYQNAIQLDPRFAEAHFKLAKADIGLMNWDSALAELRKAVDLQPSNIPAQLELGKLYLAAHQYGDGEQAALVVLEKEPGNPEGHALMANLSAAQKRFLEAQPEFDKALELAPNNASIQFSYGMYKFQIGDKREAETRFKRALELDPKLTLATLALADVYNSGQNFTAVERVLRDGIAQNPRSVALYKALAQFYEIRSRRADAVSILADGKSKFANDPEGYRMLGDFYAAVGDSTNALQEFASLNKEHPGDLATKITYTELLISSNRLDDADRLIEEVLKTNNRDSYALILKSQVFNIRGKYAEAAALLESSLNQMKDNPATRLQLGVAYNGLGESSRAEAEWRESVRLNPNQLEAQGYLGAVGLRKSDPELLRTSAESFIRQRPNAPIGYVYRASAKILQRDFSGAEIDLKRVIELAPNSPDGYIKTGMLRALQKRYADAEKLFETALEKDPNNAEPLAGLINTYGARNQPIAKSIARLNAQIAKSPQNDAIWVLLAQAQTSAGDPKTAQASLERALGINQNNAAALTMLAQAQASSGALDSAAATYQRLINSNPRSATPLILLGTLEQARGNFDRARQLFQKALDLEPYNPVAANNLAYLIMEKGGDIDLAVSLAQTARRGMPDNASTADTMGWAYYLKGLYGPARDMLEVAVRTAPENAAIHYHLGMTYDKIQEPAKSAEHLKKSLQLAPNGPNAVVIRQTLGPKRT